MYTCVRVCLHARIYELCVRIKRFSDYKMMIKNYTPNNQNVIVQIHKGRKEGNVLFNDALNTFYLRLYGVGHMVKDHSKREKERERKPASATTWATGTLSD